MDQSTLNHNIFLKFEKLRETLKSRIYDQDDAVDEVVDAFVHMVCKPQEAPPRALFTFLGPPAVGKAWLARLLGEVSDDIAGFRQFDMGQYTTPEDAARLLGQVTPDGVQEGEISIFLKKNPRAVMLFNEIEKAENPLQLAILELLTGTSDENGPDRSQVIVIFSTTLGSTMYQNREFMRTFGQNRMRAQTRIMEAVSKEQKVAFDLLQSAIDPKLLSVLSRNYIVLFNRLSLDAMVRISTESLAQFSDHFIRTAKIDLKYANLRALATLLTLSFAPQINIKQVRQKLPDMVLEKITRHVRESLNVPRQALFDVSEQAQAFLSEFCREPSDLLHRLLIRNETVELTWEDVIGDGDVVFRIEKAELHRFPQSRTVLPDDLPPLRFSDTGFEDIAGNASVKKTLREIITVLRSPDQVKQFTIDMPKGMLLYGAEGVGKTLMGRAFARESELPYLYVSGGELFDPDYIRQVYSKANAFAPCIVFLDEIDVKGLVDGVLTPIPADHLVSELEAISSGAEDFVFTIATAQDRNAIDPGLTASGRIDIFVEIPEFDREARRFFIEKILEKPHDGKIDVDKVVRYISGMSGYDLERIGRDSALYAIRNHLDCITEEILIEQINNIKYGHKLDKKQIRNIEEDLKKTACHEAAHAVLSYLLMPHVKIEQVTIAPRYETMGFVSYSAEDFAGNITRGEIVNNICVMLAGRTAQIREFGPEGVDSGAANDLEQATYLAYAAIAALGMDDEIGYVHVDTLCENVSKTLFRSALEARLSRWLADATARTGMLVEKHWKKIEYLAEILVSREIVDGAELDQIMKN
ncbi:hypothetical protein DENIS_1802 [Desulfonema ishimotonii]|uniref:AAA+ ATPase domain-containing protein n=1 Tax=Desulfonema ishimotonii TaxID=45657 RepID=A0A401FV60_9BACT|nr:AAA family ATPase [Desulfonema ishimotonii]GBC60843.1 hypothetical protein DENIS_1802 [Desulfonema ishimotonii]